MRNRAMMIKKKKEEKGKGKGMRNQADKTLLNRTERNWRSVS
jgi:hypothetical protein